MNTIPSRGGAHGAFFTSSFFMSSSRYLTCPHESLTSIDFTCASALAAMPLAVVGGGGPSGIRPWLGPEWDRVAGVGGELMG